MLHELLSGSVLRAVLRRVLWVRARARLGLSDALAILILTVHGALLKTTGVLLLLNTLEGVRGVGVLCWKEGRSVQLSRRRIHEVMTPKYPPMFAFSLLAVIVDVCSAILSVSMSDLLIANMLDNNTNIGWEHNVVMD